MPDTPLQDSSPRKARPVHWRVRYRRAFWRPLCRHLDLHNWWGMTRVMLNEPRFGDVRTCLRCGRQESLEVKTGWTGIAGRS